MGMMIRMKIDDIQKWYDMSKSVYKKGPLSILNMGEETETTSSQFETIIDNIITYSKKPLNEYKTELVKVVNSLPLYWSSWLAGSRSSPNMELAEIAILVHCVAHTYHINNKELHAAMIATLATKYGEHYALPESKSEEQAPPINYITNVTKYVPMFATSFQDEPMPKLARIEYMVNIVDLYWQMKSYNGYSQMMVDSRRGCFQRLVNTTRGCRETKISINTMMNDIETFLKIADNDDMEYISSVVVLELSEFNKVVLNGKHGERKNALMSLSVIYKATESIARDMKIWDTDSKDIANIPIGRMISEIDYHNDSLVESVILSVTDYLNSIWNKIHIGFTNDVSDNT